MDIFTLTDTIAAISTAPGVGGIAVARLSGPQAFDVMQKIWRGKPLSDMPTHTVHLGTVLDTEGRDLDQAVITIFRGTKSYTGQDTVEISVHGGSYIQQQLINSLLAAGARLAQPGEFTRRAFAAGHLDLAQAEAVADLIAADSRAAHDVALNQMRGHFSQQLANLRNQLIDLASLVELELDFSDQDVTFADRKKLLDLATRINETVTSLADSFAGGNAIRDGIPVAIIGPTNAGKSMLLNALTGHDRAIVSDIHGTTRDTIEDTMLIGDFRFRFIDTAGLRKTDDPIERLGIDRSHQAAAHAAIILNVIDATNPVNTQIDNPNNAHIINLLNKTDLITPTTDNRQPTTDSIPLPISAKTGQGLDTLRTRLQEIAAQKTAHHNTIITNARHAEALRHAADSSQRVINALHDNLPGDLIALDIRDTISHLSTITGDITTPTLLQTIFQKFCIGK